MKKLLFLSILTWFAVMALPAEEINWYTNYQDAKKAAIEKKLPMYLLFTGSDWCPWCKKLHNEVLTQPPFQDYVKDKLVMVYLDFPQSKPQTQEIKMQNESLSRTYKVEGFPTIIITDAQGKQIGQLSYSPLKEHLDDLKQILNQ